MREREFTSTSATRGQAQTRIEAVQDEEKGNKENKKSKSEKESFSQTREQKETGNILYNKRERRNGTE